ncbi:MAG: hydantoinase/oxoprolinase family protein [Bacillota bacterium]
MCSLKIIGWDIGGANIKATRIVYESQVEGESNYTKNIEFAEKNKLNRGAEVGGDSGLESRSKFNADLIKEIKSVSRYFPMWEKDRSPVKVIREMISLLGDADYFSVVMTAELSDRFFSKREGIDYIISLFKNNFSEKKLYFYNYSGELKKIDQIKNKNTLAAANWAVSAKFLSYFEDDFVLFDLGSTTVDLIPVMRGRLALEARTDTERLCAGELIYLGLLRTNLADVVDQLPYRGKFVPVMREYFASTADVHLLTGIISSKEYTVPAADGRDGSKKYARNRIARLIGSDLDLSTAEEIDLTADYILSKEICLLKEKIYQIYSHFDPGFEVPLFLNRGAEKFSPYLNNIRADQKKISEEISILKNNILTTTAAAFILAEKIIDKKLPGDF